MTDTTVAYHADGYRPARPAINVKCRGAGGTFWPRGWPLDTDTAEDVQRRSNLIGVAMERVQSDFWQAAQEIATQRGLGEIEQEGRSGGWLVFSDGRDPDEMLTDPNYEGEDYEADRRDWLAAYRAMAEWAEAYVAAAPGRVARLAQDMAMDALGAAAVNQVVLP